MNTRIGDIVKLRDRGDTLWVVHFRAPVGPKQGWRCVTPDTIPQGINVLPSEIEHVARPEFEIGEHVTFLAPTGPVDAEIIAIEKCVVTLKFDERYEMPGGIGFTVARDSIVERSVADIVLDDFDKLLRRFKETEDE
jgi:hypothetical protein